MVRELVEMLLFFLSLGCFSNAFPAHVFPVPLPFASHVPLSYMFSSHL